MAGLRRKKAAGKPVLRTPIVDPPHTQEEKMLGESIAKLWQSDIMDIHNFSGIANWLRF